MSNGKSDLFVYLGGAFATLIGLSALQAVYGAYVDISYHKQLSEAGPSEALLAARQEDAAQAQKRKLPLDQAISQLGQRGRTSFSAITPKPSTDLSAISGWIHHPGFKPVTAHPVRSARGSVVAQAQDAASPATPAPAAAAADVAAPTVPSVSPAEGDANTKAPAVPAQSTNPATKAKAAAAH
jgi:hypothetical protein